MQATNQNLEALQCLLLFSYNVGERNILQTVLSTFFSAFTFSMLDEVVVQFISLDINIFWALLRGHFSLRLTARAKTSLSRARERIYSIGLLLFVFSLSETKHSSPFVFNGKSSSRA